MALPNIFTKAISDSIIQRIELLNPDTKAQWGVMTVDQMLAHCNVTYEMAYENIHPEPNFILKLILKAFVKKELSGKTHILKITLLHLPSLLKVEKILTKKKTGL